MTSRRGFAVVAAICALVVLAVVVTGVLFATSQETHASAAQIMDEKAFSYAERMALTTAGVWSCAECDSLPVGSLIRRSPAGSPPLESTVFITRLDSALFLVTAEGRINDGNGVRIRRRVSIAVAVSADSLGARRSLLLDGIHWTATYQM